MMGENFKARLSALAAILIVVAIAVAGCGSDADGDSSDDPQVEIKTLAQESFAFEDLEKICEENLTEAALAEGYEGEDQEARLESCKKQGQVGLKEITVSKVEVNGSIATAEVTHTNQNGRRSTFAVRFEDEDGWKIDKILGAVPK